MYGDIAYCNNTLDNTIQLHSFILYLGHCNRTWSLFLILGLRGGWTELPRRNTHSGINNYLQSSSCGVHFSVPRVVFKLTTIDRPWYPEKNTVLVFGCLSAPQR